MSIKNILRKLNSRDTQILPSINTLTKIVFITLIAITTTFFVKNILATDKKTITEFMKKQEAMTTGNNQESWMKEAAMSNIMVINNALVGEIPIEVLNGDTTPITWIPGGIIGLTNQAIAYLYKPPFSGTQYIADTFNNFLGKPAYAATGYVTMSSLKELWKGFRNITYAIFSIIFIAIGIMIMLRIKISQNAVISIQSAIPKLITSLILVTFSYAIVGLLIDLSYVIEAIGLSIIYGVSENPEIVSDVIARPDVFLKILNLVPAGQVTLISGIIAGGIAVLSSGLFLPASIMGFVIIVAILFLTIVIYMAKFFIGLVKCYINILLRTIIGPLEIAVGAIPNMKIGFGSWFINILANILVFPISMIFLVMIKTIMVAINEADNMWVPTGLESFSGGGIISVIIGLGGLMLVSKLPTMIPELIFQIKPSPWGKAIGENLEHHVLTGAYNTAKKGVTEQIGADVGGVYKSKKNKLLGKVDDTIVSGQQGKVTDKMKGGGRM